MIGNLPLVDLLLSLLLLWLGWRLLRVPDLFEGTVLFISFGLLLSLAWVRLEAPDIALAEAAIGAGVTGALILAALPRLQDANPPPPSPGVLLSLLALGLFGTLASAVLSLPEPVPGAGKEALARLGESGVGNPVTAVLLNFRGYDTFLEVGVLFLAAAGTWAAGEGQAGPAVAPGDVLQALTRLLLPLCVLVSGYLLWRGENAPGGAFQGGAVLAAGALLLLLSGRSFALGGWRLRLLLGGGFGVFLAVAVLTAAIEGHVLHYPAGTAKGWILLIEGVLTPAIALTLVALFLGGPPSGPKKGRGEGDP